MTTQCDTCGDISNSAPDLQCGRVSEASDLAGELVDGDQPCSGTYRIMPCTCDSIPYAQRHLDGWLYCEKCRGRVG